MDCGSSAGGCAILFGIPVNREEFDCVARLSSRSDYMTGMLGGNDPASVWASDYQQVAGAAQQMIKTASELGTGIYQRAMIRDLADATARFQTIVLFAHWRGAMLRPRDLFGEIAAVINRMERHPVLQRVKPACRDLKGLVDALNEAIEEVTLLDSLPGSLGQAGRRSRTVGQTLCRDLIDEGLSGLVAPGNRVELFDGLHAPAEMETALYSGFSGEIDLALCNSEALATFLDLRRRNIIQHIHWPVVLHPLPQLLKVEKTLQLMARYGGDYIQTRLSLEEAE